MPGVEPCIGNTLQNVQMDALNAGAEQAGSYVEAKGTDCRGLIHSFGQKASVSVIDLFRFLFAIHVSL